jgi:hypothetical protein
LVIALPPNIPYPFEQGRNLEISIEILCAIFPRGIDLQGISLGNLQEALPVSCDVVVPMQIKWLAAVT